MGKKNKFRFFSIHSVTGSLFVVLITLLLSSIPVNIDFFNPLVNALRDFNMTDIVFKEFKDKKPFQENIVLVNIGDGSLGREGMAAQLEIINKYHPAVVGIDAFFKTQKDFYADSLLQSAIAKTKNLVLVSKLDSFDVEKIRFNHLIKSHPQFSANAHSGFANFITDGDDGYLTTRRCATIEKVDGDKELSFCSKILQLYDPSKFNTLVSRKKSTEIINYSGNLEHFYRLDVNELLDSTRDLSFLKDKIVLMGFLGRQLGDPSLEDIFFTPLNNELGGRSVPDMYGITVHANILSMMLGEYYINEAPAWLDPFLAILFCLLNVSLFLFFSRFYSQSSQLLMRIVQVIEGTIITGIVIYLLSTKDVYIEVTVCLAILFLTADLCEIYEGSFHSFIEKYVKRKRRPINARSKYYKKRRLFSK